MNRFQPHHHMYYIQSFNPSIMHRTNNHDMMLQFYHILSLNTDDVTVLCRILIAIISYQPNTSAYTPLDADTRASFISQESIGSIGNLWFTEHEDVMEMKETETSPDSNW
eukprot:682403_1